MGLGVIMSLAIRESPFSIGGCGVGGEDWARRVILEPQSSCVITARVPRAPLI